MTLFANEEALEKDEMENKSKLALISKLLGSGENKAHEPHTRNKKLRSWPAEAVRKEIYMETMVRETGQTPERSNLEAWKQKQAAKLWDELTFNISPESQRKIFWEHAICHIAKVIANTIHLEKMYTTLKPIGEKQWEQASKGLKALADDTALHALTERGATGNKIPDWVKGAILYLSLIGSKKTDFILGRKQRNDLPDAGALKAAAQWCLGNHLKVGGKPQTLEETAQLFGKWQDKRKKIDLHIASLEIKDIPQESEVPPATDMEDNTLEWNTVWKILPIVEKEIREIGERVLSDENAFRALGDSFKIKTFDRWNVGIAQRAYIRSFERGRGVGERWMTKKLVLDPLDAYISDKVRGKTPLRLLAKTEAAWQLTTEDLPEPELA